MNDIVLIAGFKLKKSKRFILISASIMVILFLCAAVAAFLHHAMVGTIAKFILLVPLVSCFYLCSATDRFFFESHLLTRGVERDGYFWGGALACAIPSLLLMLPAWLSFVILQALVPDSGMSVARAVVMLVLLLADVALLLSLAHSSGVFGYSFANFAMAVVPLALSFKPVKIVPMLQASYAFPVFMIDPPKQELFSEVGGLLHLVENVGFSAIVLLVALSIFKKKDIG